jgi:hypothetical protein
MSVVLDVKSFFDLIMVVGHTLQINLVAPLRTDGDPTPLVPVHRIEHCQNVGHGADQAVWFARGAVIHINLIFA